MSLKEYCLKNGIQINLPEEELAPLSEEKIQFQTIGEIFDLLKKRGYKNMPPHIKIFR